MTGRLLPLLFLMQATPTFDVASIKESTGPFESSGIKTEPGRITARNVTLRRCIRGAYDIPESQVLGGPKWADEIRYNIDAKAPGPSGDHDLMMMLQSLLAERFKLVIHKDTRPQTGYALVVDKNGVKAKASLPDAGSRTNATRNSLDADGCSMAQLAQKLAEALHAPVADQTRLEGRFTFILKWTPEDLQSKTAAGEQGPSLFAALQEQLGLKLETRKMSTEVVVIDQARAPTEN